MNYLSDGTVCPFVCIYIKPSRVACCGANRGSQDTFHFIYGGGGTKLGGLLNRFKDCCACLGCERTVVLQEVRHSSKHWDLPSENIDLS